MNRTNQKEYSSSSIPNYHLLLARDDNKEDEDYYRDAKNITEPKSPFLKNPISYMINISASRTNFFEKPIGASISHTSYLSDIKISLFENERLQDFANKTAIMKLKKRGINYPKLAEHEWTEVYSNRETYNVTYSESLRAYRKEFDKEIYKIRKDILDCINGMIAHMCSNSMLRFYAVGVDNFLARLYNQGIHIKESEFSEVRKFSIECEKKKIPMIFLPCHKSHVDYVVISYLFFKLGIVLPHIAAGDNLNIPIVGRILRQGGAFFMKRKFGNEKLYQEVFREYLELLLEKGYNIEVFIEGTRSRVGKLLTPKFGVLKIILDCLLLGKVKDAICVPLSIDYDRVIETESYVTELLGKPKQRESLMGLLNSANLLSLKFGRIDIRFSKPFSLRDWINMQVSTRSNAQTEYSPLNNFAHKSVLLLSLGYKILSDINNVSVIMPTALVGTVLLTLRGRGVGREELIRRTTWLRREIILKGGRVADFRGAPMDKIVDKAVAFLSSLVGFRQDLLEPVFFVKKRFELSYYRNQVLHLFIHEALLCAAMYATIKKGQNHRVISWEDLLRNVSFLSQLLKTEFIFKPGPVEANVILAISYLEEHEVLEVIFRPDGKRDIRLSEKERLSGRENYDFYCFLIWPFIETYWLAATSLFCIIPTPAVGGFTESDVIKRTQTFGKTLYFVGDLGYFESVNKEILQNAFKRYEQMNYIFRRLYKPPPVLRKADLLAEEDPRKEVPLLHLNPDIEKEILVELKFLTTDSVNFESSEIENINGTRLWRFVETVGNFRREGKHRRDNHITAIRTLRLARLIQKENIKLIASAKL